MSMLSPTAPDPTPLDTRVHALDHLRASAMLLGVVFHAALAYSPLLHGFWPTADRQQWWGVDALIWGLHLVRMPLFFLVSGFFTAWLLARRGMAGLMRQRVRRILLPLLVALPLLHVFMLAITRRAAEAVEHPSMFLDGVRTWMAMTDPPQAPVGTGHLWFLYYLVLFSVLTWVARALEFGALLDRVLALGPRTLALALPMLLIPGFALTHAPHPAPEGLLPQFWAIALYGPFFVLGVAFHGRLDWLRPLQAWLLPGAIVCAAAYLVYLRWIAIELPNAAAFTTPWQVVLLQAAIAAWSTLLCVIAALRWFDRPSAGMRYLAASAYWVYLLHLPLLFAIQYALMDVEFGWVWKFLLALTATMAGCLLSYEALVRRTGLRRFVG